MSGHEGEFQDALEYVFNEYNEKKDGQMTRKDFFTFLWELKQAAKQSINQGQMLDCWLATSNKKETITFDDFKEGLEICYEYQFFATKNGARPAVFRPDALLEEKDDPKSYDTVKFQQSLGVAAFEQILSQEKKPPARPMTMYGQAKPKDNKYANTGTPEVPYVPRRMAAAGGSGSYASSAAGPAEKKEAPVVNSFGFKVRVSQLQQERDMKKQETQKKVDAIMASRFQEERKRREDERKAKEEEMLKQRSAEASALVSEPAWMKALKTKPAGSRY